MSHERAAAPLEPPPERRARSIATRPAPFWRRFEALDWLVIGLAFTLHAAFFPWFPKLRSPNELTRVYLASALVEDRTVSIDPQLRAHGRIFDVAVRKVDGKTRHYSDKAPGVALVSLIPFAVYDALSSAPTLETQVRIARLFASTLPTLLLLPFLLAYLAQQLEDRRLARMLVLAYATGSVATAYASLAFGHQLSAVVLFALFLSIHTLGPETALRRSAAVGACASFALMVEYQNALLLLPFAVLFARRVRLRPAACAAAMAGALPLTLLLLGYHQAAFGSPFATGYSFLASSFKDVHAQGLMGVALPKAAHAYLSFLSPAKGLFFFAPWLSLALPGLWPSWSGGREGARFHAVFVVLYALFVSSLVYPVGGWTVSQRHLVPAVPFMLLPVGLFIQRCTRQRALARAVFTGLAWPAIVACALSAVVWPHYQENLQNPFWQVGWPLYRDGWVAPSLFGWLGVSSATAATLLVALALGLLGLDLLRSVSGWTTRAGLLAAALATSAGFVAVARLPGRAQDVSRDRAFIERVYVREESSPPAAPR